MSKSSNPKVGEVGYGAGLVVDHNIQDRLVGKLLPIIETMGLKDSQEISAKDLIRERVWDIFKDAIFITPERNTEIITLYQAMKRKAFVENTPTSLI